MMCGMYIQFIEKPKGKRLFDRLNLRWKGNMIVTLKEIKKQCFKFVAWIQVVWVSSQWQGCC